MCFRSAFLSLLGRWWPALPWPSPDIPPKPNYPLVCKDIPQTGTGVPGLLLGSLLPFGVRFPCSGLYSSSLKYPKIERKVSLSESLFVPNLVRSIGMCWKSTQRLDRRWADGAWGFNGVLWFNGIWGFGKADSRSELVFFAFAAWSLSSRSFICRVPARIRLQVITHTAGLC